MKFSEAWLREWVNPELNRDELMSQLTMAGLEVDGTEPVSGEFTGVVVGLVESVEKHPDADKLSVCQVSDGQQKFQVVCGAPNVRAGLLTAFAKVGAVLPENFKIKKAKLRGVESHGMLCSVRELGLGDEHDGIIELDSTLSAGEDINDALNLDDVIVDLDLTPNRGDCLSLKGLAREVGVLNNLSVEYPQIETVQPTLDETEASFKVSLAAPDACPRYLGRVLKNIDITQSSPDWMVERLRRCGLRSIDPVVDVTNYVLIELGQPMHAFDLNELNEEIVVRYAQAEETLTLLDGTEAKLDEQTLLITDKKGPLAIAGVMGGARSGVQQDSKDIFLECAFFAPLAIAGTARRYGLHTDASHRYERGVDWSLQFTAVERASQLLLDIVGGELGPIVEAKSADHLPTAAEVSVRLGRLNELLGVEVSAQQVDEAFARLDFEVTSRETIVGKNHGVASKGAQNSVVDDIKWTIIAPSHRFDIAQEADLVEEVCRIYGYNNIPSKQPLVSLGLAEVPIEQHPESELKSHFADLGFQEVISYSFVDPKLQSLLDPLHQPVELANPMSSEMSVMRTSLLPGMVEVVRTNAARQQDLVRAFELGLTFVPSSGEGLQQPLQAGGILWGARGKDSWHHKTDYVDFYDAKGVLEDLFEWAGVVEVEYLPLDSTVYHPGQSAQVVVAGEKVGELGRLHPSVEAQLGLEGIYAFEIDARTILSKPRRKYSGLSRYPAVRRDFAIVVDKNIAAIEVEKTVGNALGSILVDFRLFDVYEGKGIDSNEKSLAIRLTLQSQTATLTEEEITVAVERVMSQLEANVGARLR